MTLSGLTNAPAKCKKTGIKLQTNSINASEQEIDRKGNNLMMQQNHSPLQPAEVGKDQIPQELFALQDSDYQALLMNGQADQSQTSMGCTKEAQYSADGSEQKSRLSQSQRRSKIKKLERQLMRLKKQSISETQNRQQSQITSKFDSGSSFKPCEKISFQNAQQKAKAVGNNEKYSQHSTQAALRPSRFDNELVCAQQPKQQQAPTWKYPRYLHNPSKLVNKRTLESICKKFKQIQQYLSPLNSHIKLQKPLSLQQIGCSFDIHFNQICNLYTEWQRDHTFYDRIMREDLFKRTPQKRLTLQRLEHVSRLIKENPFLTLNQLCIQLNKIEDLKSLKEGQRQEITKTTVARLLQVGKFKKKRVRSVPKERNTAKQLQKRYEFCARYKQLLQKQAKIYFLDESGFNLYMIRQKAWSRPKEQITVNCPISKGKRFSLIAIIGEEGLAHWRIIDGNYRKYEYLDFIHELFERLYSSQERREKWLIMDNCSIHDKEETMKLADRWGVRVMYLPAYSPQLNPIEMWFHELKTKIRKINYAGERQLLEIMERTLKEYEDHDFSNYYHGSLKFVEKGLRKEKF